MRNFILILLSMLFIASLFANNLYTVDCPTAGLLSKGEARIHHKIFKNNGLVVGTDVGLFDSFQFGVSYGAEQLVGDQDPVWMNKVDFKARLRLINESLQYPAFAIGVDTQGHGSYHKDLKRYDIKSKGAYLVASKNYSFAGLLGFDFGANYTFENEDDDEEKFDAFAGMYKTLGDNLVLFADFSAGINDNNQDNKMAGRGRGYLNTGIQLRVNDQLTIKLLMHDLLQNRRNTQLFDRSLLIDYRWFF